MYRPLAAALALVALSGCAPDRVQDTPIMPPARAILAAPQDIVASAAHWRSLADEVGAALVSGLPPRSAVTVFGPERASDFDAAFVRLLSSQLSERGALVVHADADYFVSFDAKVINNPGSPRADAGMRSEVVVDVRISHNGAEVRRATRVFYVPDGDRRMYVAEDADVRTVPVRSR